MHYVARDVAPAAEPILTNVPNNVGELDAVLKAAIETDKPVVLDVPTYPYENCYPMIPAGGCNHEMILEDPPELKRRQAGVPSTGSNEDKDTILTA